MRKFVSELKTSVIVDLKGDLERRARRYGDAIANMSRRGSASLRRLNTETRKLNNTFRPGGLRGLAPWLTGAAVVGAGRNLLSMEERYERLGVQAKISPAATRDLREKLFDTAQMSDIRIAPDKLLGAIEQIVEKTGDLKFAEQNMRNLALAIQATGAQGEDIGAIAAELQKQGITDPRKVAQVLDTFTAQGKEGAFTLQALAGLGPRVITAYTSAGRNGVDAMRELGAVLQVIRMGTGSNEQAATAFEAIMRTLTDKEKVQQLRDLAGIEVFDAEKLKKGKEQLRPINELLAEIIQKSKGHKTKLGSIFEAEAIRGLNFLGAEFQGTNNTATLNKFMSLSSDGRAILADSTRMADVGNAKIEQAKSTATGLLDSVMSVFDFRGGDPDIWDAYHQSPGRDEATVKIQVEAKPGTKVDVKGLRSNGLDVEVESGSQKVGVR